MKIKKLIGFLLILAVLFAAAMVAWNRFGKETGGDVTPAPTMTAAPTAEPTKVVEPTATCTPEPTKEPTPTESPVHVHNWVKNETPATCLSGGRTFEECECGEMQNEVILDALGHGELEYNLISEPTVDAEGEYTETCSVCGEVINRGSIEKLEPTPVPTATPTPVPTSTPTPVPTSTPTPTPTNTPTPTTMPSPTPKPTATPTPTAGPTSTPAPSTPYISTDGMYDSGNYNEYFRGSEVVMDMGKTVDFAIVTRNYPKDREFTLKLFVEDESIVTVEQALTHAGTLSTYLIPVGVGTTTVTAAIYTSSNELNLPDPVDTYTFTVTVNPFESQVVFKEGDYIPAENGYPYFMMEDKVGDNCYVQVWAESEDVQFTDREGAVMVITGTGDMWTINEYADNMGGHSGWDPKCVTKLYIQEGITKVSNLIPSTANISYVEFPSTLKVVGENALAQTYLTEVVLPEGVEELEAWAFYQIPTLERIVLPSTLKRIGRCAFQLNSSRPETNKNLVKEVVIPKGVEYCGYGAFVYRWGINIIEEDGLNTKKFSDGWDATTFGDE